MWERNRTILPCWTNSECDTVRLIKGSDGDDLTVHWIITANVILLAVCYCGCGMVKLREIIRDHYSSDYNKYKRQLQNE